MATTSLSLHEELNCSVCCEIFKDPIVLPCSHSFCRSCVQQYWEQKNFRECPLCRKRSCVEKPPQNLALRNVVESYLQKINDAEAAEKSEGRCSVHGEKLLLFCLEDEEPICLVCQTSKKHRNHQLCPLLNVHMRRTEELRVILNCTVCVKCDCNFQNQAQHTKKLIKEEFEKLHRFLRDEEEARLAALREEEEQKSQRMKEKIENISKHVSILSDRIRDTEEDMNNEDTKFLMSYKSTKQRAQCEVQDPKVLSGALIDVAKHLGSLSFRVWEKMLHNVTYTPVTLDPNTARSTLFLSDDLTFVRYTGIKHELPDNTERFDSCVCVLGSEGFTSGKHSWEVEVGNKTEWDVGVMKESISRKGKITLSPKNGFWVINSRNDDKYKTLKVTDVSLEKKPQKIRVQLDYDRGKVSFFNPTDMSHIYTFTDTFTEKLFPYFSPRLTDGRISGALKICPVKVSITVNKV
uniref:Zinc-binding protein A33-like n=1 Tax=Scleropages formosus TaxID=113540 RepID=A0A8C9R2A1_SCLFO